MIFDKHRFEIWTLAQHPLKHTLTDFAYTNPSLPGVSDVNAALNYVMKVLYPITKPQVANPAALPLIGNTLNDYRVVLDDGDGKNAGYRWEQREGEVTAAWHKVFDFDWSTDSILAAYMDVTQDLYVYQKGKQDLDASGTPITGTYAGQRIFGGSLANQNLTLTANSGDGVGAHTGWVQVDSHFRPTANNLYDIGTAALKFKDGTFAGTMKIGNITISSGSISDSGGAINLGSNALTTTGNISGDKGLFTTDVEINTAGNKLTLSSGSIISATGAITFGVSDLTTTGKITAGVNSKLADITFANGSITSLTAIIDFGANNILTTGSITCGALSATSFGIGNLSLAGNTISITNTNGNLILAANGAGVVDIQSPMTTLGQVVTGVVSITGQLNADNLRLDGNVISSTNLNGNITLTPNGSGIVEPSCSVVPSADATYDLGTSVKRVRNIYLSGGISDGTTAIAQSVLQSLRGINSGATSGMSIFFDGTNWNPSLPDTEIIHNTLSGLTTGDAGHTQFVMLAGRSGGQIVQGGTAASELLVLESTAHASKGTVQTKDNFLPFTNASYSGSWAGLDLGSSGKYWNNVYSKGEFKGFRFENFTTGTLPGASGQNIGRAVWTTDNNKIYIDVGGSWVAAGISKYINDTSWDGVQLTQTFTVSASISDARNAVWAIHDNTNNYEQIFCKIEKISATQVQISTETALPAGSYRLIGIE